MDNGETDPNDPADDAPCQSHVDCGGQDSGSICDLDTGLCIQGCLSEADAGCPDGQICADAGAQVGACELEDVPPKKTGPPQKDEATYVASGSGVACSVVTSTQGQKHEWLLLLGLVAAVSRRRSRARERENNESHGEEWLTKDTER